MARRMHGCHHAHHRFYIYHHDLFRYGGCYLLIILQNIIILAILLFIYIVGIFLCSNKKEVYVYHGLITIIVIGFSSYVYYAVA